MDGCAMWGFPRVPRWIVVCLVCLTLPAIALAQRPANEGQKTPPKPTKPAVAEAEPQPAPKPPTTVPADTDDPEDLSTVSEAVVKERIKRAENNSDLEPDERTSLIDAYNRTLDALAKARDFSHRRQKFRKLAEQEPEELAATQAQLVASRPAPTTLVVPQAPLAELEAGLSHAEAAFEEWRQKHEEAEAQLTRRSTRRQEIPNLYAKLEEERDEIDQQLKRGSSEDVSEEQQEADQMLLSARRLEVAAELKLLHQEQITWKETAELLVARRDLAAVELEYTKSLVAAWEEGVNSRRQSEVDTEANEAARQVDAVPDAVRQFAVKNAEYTRERKELAGKIDFARKQSDAVDAQSSELLDEFEKISNRAKKAGFTETVAVVLRRRRESLPSVAGLKERSREREHETAQLSLQLADHEEARGRLADLATAVTREKKELTKNGVTLTATETDSLQSLLNSRRGYLDGLVGDTGRYLESLMELETAERQLLRQTREYARFCDEHVLWIRSTVPPQSADGPRLIQAVSDVLRPSFWSRVGVGIAHDAGTNPGMYMLTLGLAGGAFLMGRRRQHQLRAEAARGATDGNRYRLAITVVWTGAITFPLVLWFLGSRVVAINLNELIAAAGRAMQSAALLLFPLRIVRMGTRLNSLNPTLLAWQVERVSAWRRVARILSWWGVPLLFLTMWGIHFAGDLVRSALGRLAFVCLQLLLWWALRRLAPEQPDSSSGNVSLSQSQWRRSVGSLWPAVSVSIPLVFAGLSLWGYHYTAVQLEVRLLGMLGLWGALCIIERLTVGWVLPRFGTTLAGAVAADEESNGGLPTIESGGAQLRHLLRMATVALFVIGCWWIWGQVFPALRIFQSIELWPHPFRILDSTDAEGTAGLITVAGVAVAIVIGIFTWFCERTLPELLDVGFLSRTQLDAGGRYAVAAVCRYSVIVLGVLAAFSQLGIGWAELNWLVAAMTVGLGFGLQEIFANFVSGLILLFERPVRIGDIVSIGDVTGTVTRIRMRATTITDGELRELIVPNKELITGRVINWTLTNTLTRLTLKVRVAMGTDPDFARGLLLGVAMKHRLVLKQPPPAAQFEEFTDNALSFTLRVCVASCDVTSQVRHELLTMIKREFQEAGIVTTVPPTTPAKPPATPVNAIPVQPPVVPTTGSNEQLAAADLARTAAERTPDAPPRPHVPLKAG
ncbi:MAG: mechanosensitive ion channel [Planctomycetota bacterium]|nr:mechanosensitive ion channel [Planctomycetota bacterium]